MLSFADAKKLRQATFELLSRLQARKISIDSKQCAGWAWEDAKVACVALLLQRSWLIALNNRFNW
jgi:hypothetical protein